MGDKFNEKQPDVNSMCCGGGNNSAITDDTRVKYNFPLRFLTLFDVSTLHSLLASSMSLFDLLSGCLAVSIYFLPVNDITQGEQVNVFSISPWN